MKDDESFPFLKNDEDETEFVPGEAVNEITELGDDDGAALPVSTFEMHDDINRIIIGLGGQGSRLVNEISRHLKETGKIPDSVDFVAIDSDRIALTAFRDVPEENRVYLGAPEEKITETMVPWLPREYRPKAGGGCGMQRITGKAMYHVHRQRIFEQINAVVRKLKQKTNSNNFMFVILNAFGGGTGSGMVIDFTLDLRRNMHDLIGQDPMIFGLGVLPSRNETIQRANGVALLKELHFLLSHKEPIVIGGRDFSNPFELYFIVGREQTGIERDDEVTKAIVRFSVDLGLIPNSVKEINPELGKGGGWVDLQDIRTLIKGSSHMFATFGTYNAVFPIEQLNDVFEVEDKIAATKAAMPRISSAVDGGFHAIQDRKVALGKLEETIERAAERASRLRATGIFSLNKAEFVRFNADITLLEERLKKERRALETLETQVPGLETQLTGAEDRLTKLENERLRILQGLAKPALRSTSYTPPLSPDEVRRIGEKRSILHESSFREIMEDLDRMPEYLDKTMEVVGKNKILFMPLLNYRMAFHTANLFKSDVLRTMANYGFVKFDSAGNPVITDDQLWMVLAMIASHKKNVDPEKLGARAFKEIIENYVAKRAEVKSLNSEIKRFEVGMYSWMIGLQISPVAPGYPPRLKELEWLQPEYEKLASDPELIQHHAFLYGDPLAFKEMTGVHVDRMDPAATNDRLTRFWSDYVPLDPSAKWGQVPPVLAEGLVDLEAFQHSLERLMRDFEALPPIPQETTRRHLSSLTTHVERTSTLLAEFTESVTTYVQATNEEEHNLVDRLDRLHIQLKATRKPPRDRTSLGRMTEMADALSADVENLLALTEQVKGILENEITAYARELLRIAKDAQISDRAISSIVSRHERTVRALEEKVHTAVASVNGLEIVLHTLRERVADLNGEMKQKTIASKSTTRRITPTSRETSVTEDLVAEEDALLERIVRDKQEGGR